LIRSRSIVACALVASAALGQSGCVPTTGPRGELVEWSATTRVKYDEKLPYCLVSISPPVTQIVGSHQQRLAGRFSDRRAPTRVQIGIGDVISVTLYESGAGGLFFPLEGGLRTGNFLTLPNQIVDDRGMITVPYGGTIVARGRTEQEIQAAIVSALQGRALEPQAVVTVVERRNAMVSVVGEVGLAVRFPASVAGERVLDAIARAGGIRSQGQDTWVLLERRSRVAVAPFEALIHEPANNIYVHPQDTIYVYKEPQTFLALGAFSKQGQVPFDAWRLTLAEALAKGGGLLDDHAEPAWVFVYRAERQQVAQELDRDCAVTQGPYVPVVYQLNLRDPAGLFLATQFPVRNKDAIYISNSRTVEAQKLMEHIRILNATIKEPVDTAISVYTLKSLIKGTATGVVVGTTTGP
jgi:polysaccharide export outer membrane protein